MKSIKTIKRVKTQIIALLLGSVLLLNLTACDLFAKAPSAETLLSQAQELLEAEEFEDALDLFLEVIDLDEEESDAYIGAHFCYLGLGKEERALKILEKGFKNTNSKKIQAILEELGELEDANLENNADVEEMDVDESIELAWENIYNEQYQYAINLLSKVLDYDNANADAYEALFYAYYYMENEDMAFSTLETGIAVTDDDYLKTLLAWYFYEEDEDEDDYDYDDWDYTKDRGTRINEILNSRLTGDTMLTFYTFSDEFANDQLPVLLDLYPEFGSVYSMQAVFDGTASTYMAKVENALNSGAPIDLFIADADYARNLASNPNTGVITEVFTDLNKNDYYKYLIDIMTVGGDLKGLSNQATPGVMYYRSDIAAKLGLNSPAEVQAAVNDWDKFVDLANKVRDEDVYMIFGIDELKRTFLNGRNKGWEVNGYLNIDEATIRSFFETTTALCDNGDVAYNSAQQWSPNWFSAMNGDPDVFAYFGPTWYLHYVLKPNSCPNGDYDPLWGQWGMVSGPQPYFWGGTFWFIPQKLIDDAKTDEAAAARLEGVKLIIDTFCVNELSQATYAMTTGDFMSKKTTVDTIKNDQRFDNPFLGGQNHYMAFADAAININTDGVVTLYDDAMNYAFDNAVNDFFADLSWWGMSFDEAYNKAIDSIVNYAKFQTDLTIPDEYANRG